MRWGSWDGRSGALKQRFTSSGDGGWLYASGWAAGQTARRVGRRAPANPATEVITDFGGESALIVVPEPQLVSRVSASLSATYREAIELGLSRGRNAMAIWEDLVDSQGFTASYQSVQRFVRKLQTSIQGGSPRSH